ncbi:Na(+)/H(+) antiporter subunit B [Dethiosulfovibrio salsuginis]|uniref:Multicomponent Na+:H+ antiporter subunit B n=1 Tax=Dethiosulfovibrio salsuginis TaxID=561720 RepID=A0A1X7K1Z2_9BACT|nr:hydrogenase subunit MbhD domain-containing protein [Dethiosulfovibrio salsuginis]SMG34117.1 multicomponent Na+:H+ antiporter subunit B [Dethiosulfovibrio salsuginis]
MTIELFVFLSAFLVLTALVSAEAEEMLSAVIALSIFGVMLAILFAVLQAPDVALTQAIINSGLVTSLFLVAYSQTGKKGDDPDRDVKP